MYTKPNQDSPISVCCLFKIQFLVKLGMWECDLLVVYAHVFSLFLSHTLIYVYEAPTERNIKLRVDGFYGYSVRSNGKILDVLHLFLTSNPDSPSKHI